MKKTAAHWRTDGVRIIRPREFDSNIAQTPGLQRLAAVTTQNAGAKKLWAGTRLRWGERLEFEAEAAAGDFIYVPPYVPHQEINPSDDLQLQCVLARSGQTGLIYNLDIEGVEAPELVQWIDDLHK
jgi:uncharacterized RmlC-like cupin family protein